MKSLRQIHQQTLDILAAMGRRRHAGSEQFDRVVRIHNRYIDNACRRFGVAGMHRLTPAEQATPLERRSYMHAPTATNHPY